MKALTFLSLLLFSLITWAKPTILIKNIRLIDGTGAPAYAASVRLQGNKIIAIGKFMALIDALHKLEQDWVHTGVVIACKSTPYFSVFKAHL